MYSIKQEYTFKSHKTISNNMHYRMIRDFSVNLSVVTVVITLMLMPPHIFASDRAWAAEWNGNSGQFTPVQETTGRPLHLLQILTFFVERGAISFFAFRKGCS
jgi:hypothetical protein